MRDRDNYEKCEHQLAKIDGRTKVLPPSASGKRVPKERNISDFTEDEIMEIAKKMGITLVEPEPEPSDEEREDELERTDD